MRPILCSSLIRREDSTRAHRGLAISRSARGGRWAVAALELLVGWRLARLLALWSRLGTQPQREVGWLHRLPYHPYQIISQGFEVCFVA
jgi:hypothetical protein